MFSRSRSSRRVEAASFCAVVPLVLVATAVGSIVPSVTSRPTGDVGRGSVTLTRPIRTNEPGTGVFIGSGALGRVRVRRESSASGAVLREAVGVADFRYTPSTHWVVGARVPLILDRSVELDGSRDSTSGIGDISLSTKFRFFRRVGGWFDRHAAVEAGIKLATGASDRDVDTRLPEYLRRRVQPGTGATDFFIDAIYQEGRRRFVYGGDLAVVVTTADERGYRFGNEVRLSLDFEYIVLPIEYRRPGHELFILLEMAVVDKQADRLAGVDIRPTARTEILLAPAAQFIATERLLLSLSVQFPVYSNVAERGLGSDFDVLGEFRYAF